MLNSPEDLFTLTEWHLEVNRTLEVFNSLNDRALRHKVYSEGRTVGRIAWHIVTSIPPYFNKFGVKIANVENDETVPSSAQVIAETFRLVALNVEKSVKEQWTGESLKQTQDAFGREQSNAAIFLGLVKHIIHHRGQISALIRQVGIEPVGLYGPTQEGRARLGLPPME